MLAWLWYMNENNPFGILYGRPQKKKRHFDFCRKSSKIQTCWKNRRKCQPLQLNALLKKNILSLDIELTCMEVEFVNCAAPCTNRTLFSNTIFLCRKTNSKCTKNKVSSLYKFSVKQKLVQSIQGAVQFMNFGPVYMHLKSNPLAKT